MQRKRCARENAFVNRDVPRWLSKTEFDIGERKQTPMEIALRNGEISSVINLKNRRVSTFPKRDVIF
jgi:hypothetical protein